MENLPIFNVNKNKMFTYKTTELLYSMEEPYLEKFKKYDNPSLSFISSMVYGFAGHLPYSMDIEQEEFVPGDFLNLEPHDVEENPWFKYSDRRTYFNSMVNWGDTFKSGILLQVCYIFQQMLLGNISPNVSFTQQDFEKQGFAKFTPYIEYNKRFFYIIRLLPKYYVKVVSSKDNEERRKNLEEVYSFMRSAIGQRVGCGVNWSPFRDVSLMSRGNTYVDGLKFDICKDLKEMFKNRSQNEQGDSGETPLIKSRN